MKDQWINMEQKEELRPYRELFCDSMNCQVTQVMTDLGFKEEQNKEAVRSKKYIAAMATYVILSHKAPKGKGHTSIVRPFPSIEPFLGSRSLSLTHSIQPSGQKAKEPVSSPASLDSRTATPPAGQDSKTATLTPGPESRTSTPSLAPMVWLLGLPLHLLHQQQQQ